MMLAAFAVFALLLAVIGVYGVMSHLVTQGTHDIGAPHGARRRAGPHRPYGHAQGMELTVAGVVLRTRRRLGAHAGDGQPAVWRERDRLGDVLGRCPGLLVGMAVVASYLPARRATSVDPLVALRDE